MLLPGSPPSSTGLIANSMHSFSRLPACSFCIINLLTDLYCYLMFPIPTSNISRLFVLHHLQNRLGKQQGITAASSALCPKTDQLQPLSFCAMPALLLRIRLVWIRKDPKIIYDSVIMELSHIKITPNCIYRQTHIKHKT